MKDSRKHLLQLVYDHDQTLGKALQISTSGSEIDFDMSTLRNDVAYLKSHGFLYEPTHILRSYCLALTEKGENFVENNFQHPSENVPSTNFHISEASFTNSIVGNNISGNTISVDSSSSLSELEKLIATKPAEDQELLKELLAALKEIEHSTEPVKRGFLAKFSGIIEKYADILTPIGKFFVGIFSSD